MNWYIRVLKKYAVFSGRARRKEYWMFVLFNFIFGLVASLIDLSIGLLTFAVFGFGLLSILYALAIFVPGLAVSVRRLHDVGKSGWYYLIVLIPIAGPIWLLVLTCTDSQTGDNKYGPNPKEEKESDNSVADRNKAIELAPDSADAYYNRGDAYDRMGEYGKAIADYNKAIELDPNHASAYYNRGCAYGEMGAYDKAVADYNKAIELNPNDSLVYYNRGLAYSKRGEVSKAVSDLMKCIELSTDPELTKDAQQALHEAKKSP
jgi:uncharacterized membrane protein YhaH (DUF805 family)/regulator of sirC expression with transglutaminase-like and TPR domain